MSDFGADSVAAFSETQASALILTPELRFKGSVAWKPQGNLATPPLMAAASIAACRRWVVATHLASKDLLDFNDADLGGSETDVDYAELASEVVFYGLSMIIPLISIERLVSDAWNSTSCSLSLSSGIPPSSRCHIICRA